MHWARHVKCIFAVLPETSHACPRFCVCCTTLLFCSRLARCSLHCVCHGKWHLHVQKWSELPTTRCFFFTFWLRNVLRATAACAFSTAQLPTALRRGGVFSMFLAFWFRNCACATAACTFWTLILPEGCAPAALASLLRNRKTLEKHFVSGLFYLFARFDLLSIYIIYYLFSDSSQDCCCICPWVVSLTSKLPSVRLFCFLLDSIGHIGHIDRMLSTWYYNRGVK